MAVKDRLAAVPVLGTALAIQDRYKRDAADQLAAAIGFFGFLSLFPLMVLAVAAAGFVYADPADQVRIADMITRAIPGFEATLGGDDTAVSRMVANVVDNRGAIGLVGLVTLVLTGMRVVTAAMTATTVVFRGAVPTGIKSKLRALVVMVVLGLLALGAVAASSLAGAPADVLPRWAAVLTALAVSLLLDTGLFLAAYRLLRGSASVGARDLLPGAVLAAVGWTALKVVGASYVGTRVEGANALYGALGGVIALLLLLYLAGRLYLYGAELSALLLERRHGPLGERPEGSATADDTATGREADDATAQGRATTGEAATAPARGGAPADERPVDPGPRAGSSAIGARTRRRLDAAEAARPRGADVRGAVGFVLGVGALTAAWRLLRED